MLAHEMVEKKAEKKVQTSAVLLVPAMAVHLVDKWGSKKDRIEVD